MSKDKDNAHDLFSKPVSKIYRWCLATSEHGEDYKTRRPGKAEFVYLSLPRIVPENEAEYYSQIEILNFKTREWVSLTEALLKHNLLN